MSDERLPCAVHAAISSAEGQRLPGDPAADGSRVVGNYPRPTSTISRSVHTISPSAPVGATSPIRPRHINQPLVSVHVSFPS
jgi:hypothetical protein